MKKTLVSLLCAASAFAAHSAPSHGWSVKSLKKHRGVAWCESAALGVRTPLACYGDIEGLASPYDLLHAGWKINTVFKDDHKKVMIFTR